MTHTWNIAEHATRTYTRLMYIYKYIDILILDKVYRIYICVLCEETARIQSNDDEGSQPQQFYWIYVYCI